MIFYTEAARDSSMSGLVGRDRSMVQPIPDGYHAITPHLVLADAAKAIRFYTRALGATERYRLRRRDGRIAHAELQIGNSRIMVADDAPECGAKSVRSYCGSPVMLFMYSSDVDELARRFVSAGGRILHALTDQFYGDRSGQFEDPEGYRWTLAQHIEDIRPEEIARRMSALRTG